MLDLDAPGDLQKLELTDESITLEWKNSKAQVDNYRIKYGPLSGGEHRELLFPAGPKDTTQAKIIGIHNQRLSLNYVLHRGNLGSLPRIIYGHLE